MIYDNFSEHDGYHQWSRNCLPFRSTWVHPRFLVGFLLLDLSFYVYVLSIVVCPFVLFILAIVLSVLLPYTDSDYPFGNFKLFLRNVLSVWSYQRDNQKQYIKEGQTRELQKEKWQKDKLIILKTLHRKDRAAGTPIKHYIEKIDQQVPQ